MKRTINVLVIDDDFDSRELLRDGLVHAGFSAWIAEDASAALSLLANGITPDAIVVDMMMPRVDGTMFVAKLRALSPRVDPYVIVLSAASPAEIPTPEGVDERHLKPANMACLLDSLRQLAESPERSAKRSQVGPAPC